MKHWCGCITEKKHGIIYITACKEHLDNNKYGWIAIQHK